MLEISISKCSVRPVPLVADAILKWTLQLSSENKVWLDLSAFWKPGSPGGRMRSDMGMSLGAHRSERDQQPPDFRAFKLSLWSLHCRHQEPGRRPRDTLYRDSDYGEAPTIHSTRAGKSCTQLDYVAVIRALS